MVMKIAAVISMGTSPPVATEFVEYIHRTATLHHLVILSTKEKMVLDGAKLVKTALNIKYPHIFLDIHELPVSDITTEEENYAFMEHSVKAIAELRRRYDILHICLAGGRKEMVASLMMIAQLMGLNSVYHVVSPHIREMNIELERIRRDIEELAISEDPRKYYELNREKFDRVMFPPLESFNVIKIPIIPYPVNYISSLKRILGVGSSVRKAYNKILLEQLKKAGLIAVTKSEVIITDDGRNLYNRVLKHI